MNLVLLLTFSCIFCLLMWCLAVALAEALSMCCCARFVAVFGLPGRWVSWV